MTDAEPQSPCISVCLLDEQDICVGCYRSADEITDWFMTDAQGKCEILQRARERLKASTDIRLS
jgi:predicted Fe-S protein YdhL (DUF1289 family)